MKNFFRKILSPYGKEKTNVYAYMFLCDFFNFLLFIFGFSAFGVNNFSKYFFSNFDYNYSSLIAISINFFFLDTTR